MATLPTITGAVTLMDYAKRLDPDGSVAAVIELLAETNEILMDMMFKEGNLPTGHTTTVRTGLPTAIWRKLYEGVPASKSLTAQITDICGMLEARSEIDKAVIELNGNTAAFRLSEADAFIEAMNQELVRALFYGDAKSSDPDAFTGLTPRYDSLGATNGRNILNAGGVGADNTSMWLVVWGENTIHGIYPKGTTAGLTHQDLGELDALDTNGNKFRALADLWQWKAGLTVKDWRYAVRIGNIDISDLKGVTGTQALTAATSILKLMARSFALIQSIGKGKACFYANRTVISMLAVIAQEKTSSVLSVQDGYNQLGDLKPGYVEGMNLRFLGVPIRLTDGLLNTETVVGA
jgi:hypothetical protein